MNAHAQTLSTGRNMEPAMALALAANFGSVERWREAFVGMAKAHGGSGSVVLAFRPQAGSLVNDVAANQTASGGVPILTMDMPKDASPTNVGARVDAFVADIDWARVYELYQHAVHAASEPFAATHEQIVSAFVLDVRRSTVYDQASAKIPGAVWRDPARVADWSGELPADREVIVYCVYGHEVGRATAMRLRAAGVKARFLRGGIDGWQAAGRTVIPKGE